MDWAISKRNDNWTTNSRRIHFIFLEIEWKEIYIYITYTAKLWWKYQNQLVTSM